MVLHSSNQPSESVESPYKCTAPALTASYTSSCGIVWPRFLDSALVYWPACTHKPTICGGSYVDAVWPRQLIMRLALSGLQANPQPAISDLLLLRKVRVQVLCTELDQVDAHLQLFHTSRQLGVCSATLSAVKQARQSRTSQGEQPMVQRKDAC